MAERAPMARVSARPPRAMGTVDLAVRASGGRTRLWRLRHQGSAKCLLPPTLPDAPVEVTIINTAGGMTGGDRFAWTAEAGAEADLVLTTQAAERIYRAADDDPARVTARLTLGAGARLGWLPHPTILFDRGRVERRFEVDMAADATFLGVEGLILGRQAMGEDVAEGHLADRWQIRRDGRLIWADALVLSGPIAALTARPAIMGGARAALSLIAVGPGVMDRLEALRRALPPETRLTENGYEAGVSAWEGMLACRAVAADGQRLVELMTRAVDALNLLPAPRGWGY
ncbi:MAG: urease accessory protein UreD [Pseudomonadota bacterium]